MLSRWYFQIRYGQYLRSAHGVKQFAEMCMGQLVRGVTKKSAFYREMNENLLVEKANLRMRAEELFEQPMLQPGRYFSIRRRLIANGFIVTAAVTASIFLIYLSVSSYISTQTGTTGLLTWTVSAVLAVVLSGGGLVVAERLIETIIARRISDTDSQYRLQSALLWGFLLVGIELALLGVVEVWADRLALTQQSDVLYYGFVALTMLLPIVAGSVRWDAMGHIEIYKTTRAHRDIDSRLAQVDSILRQNEEYESNHYKMKSISYWDLLNDFKAVKDLYNERNGVVEHLGGHFAQTYDAFQREAYKRYEADIRDLKSASMRRLDDAMREPAVRQGYKISRITATPSEAIEKSEDRPPAQGSDGQSRVKTSELYLSPKPIR